MNGIDRMLEESVMTAGKERAKSAAQTLNPKP